MIKPELLIECGVPADKAGTYHLIFSQLLPNAGINTAERISAFLATLMVESRSLSVLEENLNYSAQRLAEVWPKRFKGPNGQPNSLALSIARKPREIANIVYGGRMGNTRPEDGWTYRGRAPIMITGYDNYSACSAAIQVDLINNPDLLVTDLRIGIMSSIWFWTTNNINAFADKGDLDGVRDKVNIGRKTERVGDAHGYKEFVAIYKRIYNALKINY